MNLVSNDYIYNTKIQEIIENELAMRIDQSIKTESKEMTFYFILKNSLINYFSQSLSIKIDESTFTPLLNLKAFFDLNNFIIDKHASICEKINKTIKDNIKKSLDKNQDYTNYNLKNDWANEGCYNNYNNELYCYDDNDYIEKYYPNGSFDKNPNCFNSRYYNQPSNYYYKNKNNYNNSNRQNQNYSNQCSKKSKKGYYGTTNQPLYKQDIYNQPLYKQDMICSATAIEKLYDYETQVNCKVIYNQVEKLLMDVLKQTFQKDNNFKKIIYEIIKAPKLNLLTNTEKDIRVNIVSNSSIFNKETKNNTCNTHLGLAKHILSNNLDKNCELIKNQLLDYIKSKDKTKWNLLIKEIHDSIVPFL